MAENEIGVTSNMTGTEPGMNERRYYYRGIYGICATIGFVGAYLIFLGVGVVLPMVCLLLALASAMFARSSFLKRRELLERASG